MVSPSKTYLLDTQVALWLMLGHPALPEKNFRARFLTEESPLLFHQVSTWEIQIKYGLKKLPLTKRPEHFLLQAVKESGFRYSPIDDQAIFFLERLPEIHRDPFDRLLISHAALAGWTIITSDKTFESYPVKTELV
jgi:PIN domain nuclease of toxin-antitoxin system